MKYGVVFPQIEFENDVQAIKDYAHTAEGLGYDYLLVYSPSSMARRFPIRGSRRRLRQREEYVARRGRREDGHLVVDMTQSLPMCARHATDWLRA
jgi:hypothetical protein